MSGDVRRLMAAEEEWQREALAAFDAWRADGRRPAVSYTCTAERNDYLARVWILDDGQPIVEAAPVRVGPALAASHGITRRRLPRRAILIEHAALFTGPASIDGKEARVDGGMTVVGCPHGTYIASLAAMGSDAKARAGTIRLAGVDGRVLLTRQ